jgi:hypothetical protein
MDTGSDDGRTGVRHEGEPLADISLSSACWPSDGEVSLISTHCARLGVVLSHTSPVSQSHCHSPTAAPAAVMSAPAYRSAAHCLVGGVNRVGLL